MSFRFDAAEFAVCHYPNQTIIVLRPGSVPAGRGYNDVHVTLPWKRRFRPHVTMRGPGRAEERFDLLDLPLAEFVSALGAMQLEFARAWWERQVRVTGELLADEGWTIYAIDDGVLRALAHCFVVRGNSLHLTCALDDLIWEAARVVWQQPQIDPRDLARDVARARSLRLLAFRADESGGESAWLHYVERPGLVGCDGGPGWYALPLGPDTAKMLVEVVVMRYRGLIVELLGRTEAALGFPDGTFDRP